MSLSVGQSVAAIRRRLEAISATPQLESVRMHAAALALPEESWLYAHSEELMPVDAVAQISAWVERRSSGEPLAYLLGEWEFYGRPFTVSAAVLVPRPETELLVERALSALEHLAQRSGRPLVVADVGTGSGCIAITLALEAPAEWLAHVVASDISVTALHIAQRNAERHGVEDRIEWRQGSLLDPFHDLVLDMLVSNPPYVPTAELARAGEHRESRGLLFEPHQALDGGDDGRRYVDQLAASGIPAVIESVGGILEAHNLPL